MTPPRFLPLPRRRLVAEALQHGARSCWLPGCPRDEDAARARSRASTGVAAGPGVAPPPVPVASGQHRVEELRAADGLVVTDGCPRRAHCAFRVDPRTTFS